MAKSTPEAEFDLKKRLLGALILIGLGVVVLPALLGDKEPQSNANDTQTPSAEDSKVFVSKITPIGGATPQPVAAPSQDENNEQNASIEGDASGAVNPGVIEPVVSESSESSASKQAEPAPEPESQARSSPEPEPESPRVKTNEPGWAEVAGVATVYPRPKGSHVEYRFDITIHLRLPKAEKWGGQALTKMIEFTANKVLEKVTSQFPSAVQQAAKEVEAAYAA